jgi:hypothetical protein
MARCMHHANDHQGVIRFVHLIDHPKGKPIREPPPDVLRRIRSSAIQQRIHRQLVPDLDNLLDERGAETRLPRFIPTRRLGDIVFHFRPEHHAPAHTRNRERRRAFISSSEIAEAGSARCASSRSSTNFSSAADRPGSSNSKACLTSIWRCASVNAGNWSKTSAKLMGRTVVTEHHLASAGLRPSCAVSRRPIYVTPDRHFTPRSLDQLDLESRVKPTLHESAARALRKTSACVFGCIDPVASSSVWVCAIISAFSSSSSANRRRTSSRSLAESRDNSARISAALIG